MPELRPVAVIAALQEEAHALVRRMPRSESVGPRLSVWDSGGLVVMVAGGAQVAHLNGLPWSALRVMSDSADETFDLRRVVGFGIGTAANLFESIIQSVVDEL